MKKAVVIAIIAALIAGGLVYVFTRRSSLKAALEAEVRGDYEEAMAQYLEALSEMTESRKLPDKNRANVVQPQEWYKEVAGYLRWVSEGEGKKREGLVNVLQGISRCSTYVKSEHFYTNDSVARLDTLPLRFQWQEAFFPPNPLKPGDHTALMQEVMRKRCSIFRIASTTQYSYFGSLLDLARRRRTDFFLYPEDRVYLLVEPGRYLLIVSSEVTFEDGKMWQSKSDKIWRSKKKVLPFIMPDSTSIRSIILKTWVKRKEE